MINKRLSGMKFEGVLVFFLFLSLVFTGLCNASGVICFVDQQDVLFQKLIVSAKSSIRSGLTVCCVETTDDKGIDKELSRVSSKFYDGVLVVGQTAFEKVKGRIVSDSPVALCLYSRIRYKQRDFNRFSNYQIFPMMTPFSQYGPIFHSISADRGLSSMKVAVLHKSPSSFQNLDKCVVKSFHISSWGRLKSTVKDALRWADIIWLPADTAFTSTALSFVVKSSLKQKKPLMSSSPRVIKGGAVGGLIRSQSTVGRNAVRWINSMSGSDSFDDQFIYNPKVVKYIKISPPQFFNGVRSATISSYMSNN